MLYLRSFNQFILISLALLGLSIAPANAALISFDPSPQVVELGVPFAVDLRISGLGSDILTAFDLDVSFDDSVLSYAGFDFGTGLDTFGFGANIQIATDLGGGIVNVFELSFDFDADLELFQPNDFVLGTFHFVGIGPGGGNLDVSEPPFGTALVGAFGDFGIPVALDLEVEPGSVTVRPGVVPVPATVWLFGTALIGLVGFGGRRKVT